MQWIQLVVLISVALLLAVALFALVVARRGRGSSQLSDQAKSMIPDAKYDQYELPSSVVSEQIEESALRRLEQFPDLADIVLDFGTMPDGSIDIWVNRKQYDNVDDIPDERIRQAIKQAVEEFNT